jgi:hypothetical protein
MPEQTADSADRPIPPDAPADSVGGAYWSVEECRWETVGPTRPHDPTDPLAPPVEVGAAPRRIDMEEPAGQPDESPAPSALDHLDMLGYDPRITTVPPALPRRAGRQSRTVRLGQAPGGSTVPSTPRRQPRPPRPRSD